MCCLACTCSWRRLTEARGLPAPQARGLKASAGSAKVELDIAKCKLREELHEVSAAQRLPAHAPLQRLAPAVLSLLSGQGLCAV